MQAERITGIVVTVLGLLTYFVLIPVGIVVPGKVETASLSPDFWPRIVAVIFTLCGIVITLKNESPGDQQYNLGELRQRLPRLIVVLAGLFVFYLLIPRLGMVVPAMVMIFGFMFFAGERRWILMLVTALSVPLLLYFFFVSVANIPIPLGWFEILRG